MKQGFLRATVMGLAMLIATSGSAERAGGEEEGRGGRGGPGQGMEAFRGPGGPGAGMGSARGEHGGRGRPPQGSPGRFLEQMLEPEMVAKLGLDEDQVAAIKNGVEGFKAKEEALREELNAAARAQAELLSAEGGVDEQALMNAIEKTGAIRTEMAKLRMQPIVLVKKTLTEEQIKKSRRMMHERMKRRRGEWKQKRGEKGEWDKRGDDRKESRRRGRRGDGEDGPEDEEAEQE